MQVNPHDASVLSAPLVGTLLRVLSGFRVFELDIQTASIESPGSQGSRLPALTPRLEGSPHAPQLRQDARHRRSTQEKEIAQGGGKSA